MKPIYLLPIVLFLAFVIIDRLVRKHAFKHVDDLFAQGRYEDVLEYLDGKYASKFFPVYNSRYARFNAYSMMGKTKEAYDELQIIFSMDNISDKQLDDLLPTAFQFYLKNGYYEKAKSTLDRIARTEDLLNLVPALTRIYEIVAEKSTAYIEEMESQVQNAADEATEHSLNYLIALQYENAGDKKQAEKYRKAAADTKASTGAKASK